MMDQPLQPLPSGGHVTTLLSYMTNVGGEAEQIKIEYQKNFDQSEMLTFEQLKDLLQQSGQDMGSVAKQLYDCMSKDQEGRVSFDEFVDFVFSSRTKTSQARFSCQSRAANCYTPFTFPPPWNDLDEGRPEEDDDLGIADRCSFDQFCTWLSYGGSDVSISSAGGEFAKTQQIVGELRSLAVKGNAIAGMDVFKQNSAGIDHSVRPDTGVYYLASKATLRELQQHARNVSGLVQEKGQVALEGLQCGEILQMALTDKLIETTSLHITPRLIQSLHQVVTCGRGLSPWRQEPALQSVLGKRRHRPPPASALPILVVWFCEQTQATIKLWDAHDAAAFALWWMYNLQPFSDGNGRTARGLTLAILRMRGYAPSQQSFHRHMRQHGARKRLAAILDLVSAAAGSCDCCKQDDQSKVGLKPKAFAVLSSLLQEFTEKR